MEKKLKLSDLQYRENAWMFKGTTAREKEMAIATDCDGSPNCCAEIRITHTVDRFPMQEIHLTREEVVAVRKILKKALERFDSFAMELPIPDKMMPTDRVSGPIGTVHVAITEYTQSGLEVPGPTIADFFLPIIEQVGVGQVVTMPCSANAMMPIRIHVEVTEDAPVDAQKTD